MKKILMTLAVVLYCAMMTTIFTACGSDDQDSVSNYAAYTVAPINGSGNCLTICENMREALKPGMPLDEKVCKRDDAKAIRICDEVYKSATATAHFKIVLQVTPFGNGLDNKSIDLKTYDF